MRLDYSIMKNFQENGESILLHVCCAPCAGGCVERLLAHYRRVGFYFSNSNLATRGEFEKRGKYVEQLAGMFDVPCYLDVYDHAAWLDRCAAYSAVPEGGERCRRCFEFSLGRAARAARELGYARFATSLTVSPKKSSPLIFEVGAQFPDFAEWNFKKESGYLRGREIARDNGYYLQTFCGCEFTPEFSASRAASGEATRPDSTQSE